jgi:hypothetical protein
MKYLKRACVIVSVLVLLAIVTGAAGTHHGLTKIEGQIIAYRPSERVSQVPSHVLNTESFLFKLKTSGMIGQPAVTKVIYEHIGYSDLGDDVLRKTPMLQITARRDTACDETYSAFVQGSPTLKEEQTNAELGEKHYLHRAFSNDEAASRATPQVL